MFVIGKRKQKWNHDECCCECKELDDWCSCKNYCKWNPSTCDCECYKVCKIDKYSDIKKCLCKKSLFSKLVLACEDKISSTTENLLDNKKVTCEKGNCLIHTVL